MNELRLARDRGHANHGWLDSYHSFSFADYYDPRHMGFSVLRVINEDRVQPGQGFGTHGHRDMEIVSYVLEGALAHQDNTGRGRSGVIRPGDVQRMSAGRGVLHSEFNHSQDRQTHFLQIWIAPRLRCIDPGYEQKAFSTEEKRGVLRLVASPDGADGSVTIHSNARLYATIVDGDDRVARRFDGSRAVYVHVARGAVVANGVTLGEGDALTLDSERELVLERGAFAEVLVFDLG